MRIAAHAIDGVLLLYTLKIVEQSRRELIVDKDFRQVDTVAVNRSPGIVAVK